MSKLQSVPDRVNFPAQEEEIHAFWEETDAFQESLRLSREAGRPDFSFYDGPPFATGMPHYGHFLASTLKDTVCRYYQQRGFTVERRWGWDCHGLPVEYEIDKKLGITSRDEVLKMGIDKYNAECRAIVFRYAGEWRRIIGRLGRWIDFDNDYKTLNKSFMESVWWCFCQLQKKGLVYTGYKVMPYSTACSTPLSNFEAKLNYKDVYDPEVYVRFTLVDEPDVHMLGWTTTPWTLPSNVAVCVNPTFDYVTILDTKSNEKLLLAESRLCSLYKNPAKAAKKGDYKVLSKCKGADLKGKRYQPLFNYFVGDYPDAFVVLNDEYVTSDSGTGVVHQAPAFGEDDYRCVLAAGILAKDAQVPCPVDADGRFTERVPEWKGVHVKEADKSIIQHLKAAGKLLKSSSIVHSYPFCWRSDTPLIYKTVPSWFVRVTDIRDKLIENNAKTSWVPAYVKEKRFHNWLAEARDWAVSRNRFWGTPLPVWQSDDGEERVFVESAAMLEELSGVKCDDLHREYVDKITIPSKQGKGELRRVSEVFDCWFESGSMPYAQQHYPFENKEKFEHGFPADFIAEGLDQTRGWFYTLMVMSTALFDKPAFKNLVVNGLVLAEDGKKMSKRLKNYPDPMHVINSYGADALRMYLVNSPSVRAEPVRFVESGVRDVIRDVFLPWHNAYRFFVQQCHRAAYNPDLALSRTSTNVSDRWIHAACASLVKKVHEEMQGFRLYTVVGKLVRFIDQLTNWYIRLNRPRLKGMEGEDEAKTALSVLLDVLTTVTIMMCPFTPYMCEAMYQNLKNVLPADMQASSVHHLLLPDPREDALDEDIEAAFAAMQGVILLGREVRTSKKISMRVPLLSVRVVHPDAAVLARVEGLRSYITSELGVRDFEVTADESQFVSLRAEADRRALGKRLGRAMKGVVAGLKELTHAQLAAFDESGSMEVDGQQLSRGDVVLVREIKKQEGSWEGKTDGKMAVFINCTQDEELRKEGMLREVMNRVQRMRKTAGLEFTDVIEVYAAASDAALQQVLVEKVAFMQPTLGLRVMDAKHMLPGTAKLHTETHEIGEGTVTLTLAKESIGVDMAATLEACGGDKTLCEGVALLARALKPSVLREEIAAAGGVWAVHMNGTPLKLAMGKELHNTHEAVVFGQ